MKTQHNTNTERESEQIQHCSFLCNIFHSQPWLQSFYSSLSSFLIWLLLDWLWLLNREEALWVFSFQFTLFSLWIQNKNLGLRITMWSINHCWIKDHFFFSLSWLLMKWENVGKAWIFNLLHFFVWVKVWKFDVGYLCFLFIYWVPSLFWCGHTQICFLLKMCSFFQTRCECNIG